VDDQEREPFSVLSRYRSFLAFRRGQPALLRGSMRLLPPHEQVVAWVRQDGDEAVLCIFNLSAHPARYELQPCSVTALEGHGFDAEMVLDADGLSCACAMPPNGAYFGRLKSPAELMETMP
jgi:alpha-glucosidase